VNGRYSLEQELLSRRLVTVDTLEDAKMTAAAADEPLVEALLEMRVLTEDQLVDLFHQKLGFPLVDDTYFDKLEPDTLDLVPRDLAVKNRVLPLYRSGDKLFVAAVDPLSVGLTEVAFVIQHQLIVCVARPTSILRALSLRYRAPTLLRKAPRQKALIMVSAPVAAPKTRAATIAVNPAPPAPKPISTSVSTPTDTSSFDVDLESGSPARLDASLNDLFKHTAPSVQQRPLSLLPKPDDYERARLELINAEDRDAVGRILSLFAARFYPRVVVLAHKQGMLFGWHSVGTEVSATRLKGLIVPLHLPSVFQHIVQNKTYHIGPIEPNMINSAFLAAIGDQTPRQALIVPILVEKRVATVLYADTGLGAAQSADLSLLYRLCDDSGLALIALIRRTRAQ